MSDVPGTEPEPTTDPEVEPEVEPDPDIDPDVDQRTKAAREAKHYRQRLAEAKTASEALTTERDALRASLVEELVRAKLKDPADFALHVDPAALLDPETGQLDRKRVTAELDKLLAAKPYLSGRVGAPRRPTLPLGNPAGGTAARSTPGSLTERFGADGPAWSEVLNRHSDTHERAKAGTTKARIKLGTTEE